MKTKTQERLSSSLDTKNTGGYSRQRYQKSYLENKLNQKQKKNEVITPLKKRNTIQPSPTTLKKQINSFFVQDPNSPIPKRMQPKALVPVTNPGGEQNSTLTIATDKKQNLIKTVCSRTRAGQNEQQLQKINQDIYIEMQNLDNNDNVHLFGVCDGHGQHGHIVSQFLKNQLPKNYIDGIDFDKDEITSKIKEIFQKTTLQLNKSDIHCDFSGSTCVTTLIFNNYVFTANVGDSRAILCRKVNDRWIAISLSYDQKPENPNEKKRILQAGGRVEPYKDEKEGFIGPFRVWFKHEQYPGLAMSRSFGDKIAQQVGVISQPEIQSNQLTSEDKFIVICSDGVWEFLSNQQVMDYVIPFYAQNQPQKACEKIINESVLWWKKEDEVIDDITVQCIFLHDIK